METIKTIVAAEGKSVSLAHGEICVEINEDGVTISANVPQEGFVDPIIFAELEVLHNNLTERDISHGIKTRQIGGRRIVDTIIFKTQ